MAVLMPQIAPLLKDILIYYLKQEQAVSKSKAQLAYVFWKTKWGRKLKIFISIISPLNVLLTNLQPKESDKALLQFWG